MDRRKLLAGPALALALPALGAAAEAAAEQSPTAANPGGGGSPSPAAATATQKRPEGFPYGDLTEGAFQGTLLSLGDVLARKYGARVAGGNAERQLALAGPEGELFTFLDAEGYRRLAAANLLDQAVEVRARRFPRSHVLEVLSFRPLPAEAVRRKFHCAVCTIDTQDWGPCVCCGQEMKPVREP